MHFNVESACRIYKDATAPESDRLAAFDFLHPVVRPGEPVIEPPRSLAPAARVAPPVPIVAPASSHVAPPAPVAPAPPGVAMSTLRIVVAFGAPVKFEIDASGHVFWLAPRLDASLFETRERAESAVAALLGLCVATVEPLTRGELNMLAAASAEPQPRGQRLLTQPSPAPRSAPVPHRERFIVLADVAAIHFENGLHAFRCRITSRVTAHTFPDLLSAGQYGVRIKEHRMAVDVRPELLSATEAAASKPLPVPANSLSGAHLHRKTICIVLANGEPVCFKGGMFERRHEVCDRLSASQFSDRSAAHQNSDVDRLRRNGIRVEFLELTPDELALARPLTESGVRFEGKSQPFVTLQPCGLTAVPRRSDAFAAAH